MKIRNQVRSPGTLNQIADNILQVMYTRKKQKNNQQTNRNRGWGLSGNSGIGSVEAQVSIIPRAG